MLKGLIHPRPDVPKWRILLQVGLLIAACFALGYLLGRLVGLLIRLF